MGITTAEELFACCDPEVWLVTAAHADRAGGLIATFVMKASLVPDLPRVVIGIAR
jgi:flavin reductase (DIM6/NTAB) family NADH-FMN oxidoreductase RutF